MLLVDDQRALIEKIVRANKNFVGNEDLLEDFCSESFQKSYMILNSSKNIIQIENYLKKVINTSILSVLKNSGRIRRSSEGYVSTKEVKISDFSRYQQVKLNPLEPDFVLDFPDPKESLEEIVITKDCLRNIANAVCEIHKELPSQCFYDIFTLRYIKGLKQNDIAKELNLSQSEISKRLIQLAKLISKFIDNEKS